MSAHPLPLTEHREPPPPLPWRSSGAPGAARAAANPTTLAPRLEPAALADILDGLASATDLWQPHLRHDPEQRARVRLLASPAYEVWLIGWLPGQRTELHDHGGSNAAFTVVAGELTISSSTAEIDAVRHASPLGARLLQRRLGTGTVETLSLGHVHRLANESSAPAASLHAYSRPLRSMGVFDDHDDICGHRLRTLWVDDETPVLGDRPHC